MGILTFYGSFVSSLNTYFHEFRRETVMSDFCLRINT